MKGLERLAEQNDDEKGKKESEGKGPGGKQRSEDGGGGGGDGGGDSLAEGLDVCCHLEINQNLRASRAKLSALRRSAPSVTPPLGSRP